MLPAKLRRARWLLAISFKGCFTSFLVTGSSSVTRRVNGLGYIDGVLVLPFDTPSYTLLTLSEAPFVEYRLDLQEGDTEIEIRTLPTLHVYDGGNAGYAVRMGEQSPELFDIHAGDFTAEWRWNVLRGYASRSITIPPGSKDNKNNCYLCSRQ